MICYLAGYQGSTAEREHRLADVGITHRCISFANVVPVPGLPFYVKSIADGYRVCLERGIRVMMDSGVISYRTFLDFCRRRGIAASVGTDTFLDLYARFCAENAVKWDYYVTADFSKKAEENVCTLETLVQRGLRPVPVYHGGSLDCLERYVDMGFTFIALGSAWNKIKSPSVCRMRRYWDTLFDFGAKRGVEFHGLAQTKPWVMLEYPWRSVDSSSWARMAGFGNIMRFDESSCRLTWLHVSSQSCLVARLHRNKDLAKRVGRQIEDEGFDYKALQEDTTARHIYNGLAMQRLAQFATERLRCGRFRSWI